MFKKIGSKIKVLAVILFAMLAVLYIFAGLIMFLSALETEMGVLLISGICCIIIGPVVAWISSFLLFGYGELIDKTCSIEKILKEMANK